MKKSKLSSAINELDNYKISLSENGRDREADYPTVEEEEKLSSLEMNVEEETNSSAYKKEKWNSDAEKVGKCPLCPKHNGENYRVGGHKPKHGSKKPRYKDKK